MTKKDQNSPKYKFAELIRKERINNKLSTDQVEKAGGVTRGYQWMIENKKRGIPTIEIIMKLEKGIGLKCGYLVNKAVGMLKNRVYGKGNGK